MKNFDYISPQNLHEINENPKIILDVRTKMEHAEKSISLIHDNVPLDELDPKDFLMRRGLDRESEIYILCQSGKRATQAAEKFVAYGCTNVRVIEGGILACESFGLKLKGAYIDSKACPKQKIRLSLERQVRISAGLLVAIGSFLALCINPFFAFLSLMVGFGLVFAGVTDYCGLALVLTKAPWNKNFDFSNKTSSCSASTPSPNIKTGQSCQ